MAKTVRVDHGRKDGTWPNGEKPSGWPGTDPKKNVRDLYDQQVAKKAGGKGGKK